MSENKNWSRWEAFSKTGNEEEKKNFLVHTPYTVVDKTGNLEILTRDAEASVSVEMSEEDRNQYKTNLVERLPFSHEMPKTENIAPIAEASSYAVRLIESSGITDTLNNLRDNEGLEKQDVTYSAIVKASPKAKEGDTNSFEWATVEVGPTGLNKNSPFSVMFDEKYAEKNRDTPPDNSIRTVDDLNRISSEAQADDTRGLVHEFLHATQRTYMKHVKGISVPFEESFCETVPRTVMGLQDKMPESSDFLTKLPEDKMIKPADMTYGLDRLSKEPVSENNAYGSAYLMGTAIIERMKRNNALSSDKEAAALWLHTMSKADNAMQVPELLAEKIGMDKETIMNTTTLAKEGQEILQERQSIDRAIKNSFEGKPTEEDKAFMDNMLRDMGDMELPAKAENQSKITDSVKRLLAENHSEIDADTAKQQSIDILRNMYSNEPANMKARTNNTQQPSDKMLFAKNSKDSR